MRAARSLTHSILLYRTGNTFYTLRSTTVSQSKFFSVSVWTVDLWCSFRALVSLLKAYSNVQNADKTVELLGLILKYGMILPTVFVRDVCWTAGVSETDRSVNGRVDGGVRKCVHYIPAL